MMMMMTMTDLIPKIMLKDKENIDVSEGDTNEGPAGNDNDDDNGTKETKTMVAGTM